METSVGEMLQQQQQQHVSSGWQRVEKWPGAWVLDMNGHHMLVQPERISGRRWYKWYDGHFNGSVPTLHQAKQELEMASMLGLPNAWSRL